MGKRDYNIDGIIIRCIKVRGGGRKYKEDSYEMTAPEVGTFAWLDKELMKVEREKQRLEREKLKYEERQAR